MYKQKNYKNWIIIKVIYNCEIKLIYIRSETIWIYLWIWIVNKNECELKLCKWNATFVIELNEWIEY